MPAACRTGTSCAAGSSDNSTRPHAAGTLQVAHRRPGTWELPMGRRCANSGRHAGGMQGYELRGVLPGGASTGF